MRLIIVSVMLILVANVQTARAESCAFPPANNISIPDGKTVDRETMQQTVQQVQDFAAEMSDYLTCLDTNRNKTLANMNKEQQNRWNEDYDTNVEGLSVLQTSLNEQIRIFNNLNK
jgi:hypothetical protein